MELLEILKKEYGSNKPIYMKDLDFPMLTNGALRKRMVRLVNEGSIKRLKQGVYSIPKKTRFGEVTLSSDQFAEQRYISDGDRIFGFYTGLKLLNEYNISTQVPHTIEIVTNHESSRKREITIGNRSYILRKSYLAITKENVELQKILELFRLGETVSVDIIGGMITKKISRAVLQETVAAFPDYVSKRFIESGIIYELT